MPLPTQATAALAAAAVACALAACPARAAAEDGPVPAAAPQATPADRVGAAFEVTRPLRQVDAYGVSSVAALRPHVAEAFGPPPAAASAPVPAPTSAAAAARDQAKAAAPSRVRRTHRERPPAQSRVDRRDRAVRARQGPGPSVPVPVPAVRDDLPVREAQGPMPYKPRNLIEAIFGPPVGSYGR